MRFLLMVSVFEGIISILDKGPSKSYGLSASSLLLRCSASRLMPFQSQSRQVSDAQDILKAKPFQSTQATLAQTVS